MKRLFTFAAESSLALLPRRAQRAVSRLFRHSDMEWSLAQLREKGFSPALVVDVGAYEGRWTEMIKRVFPTTRVLMVEAQFEKEAVLGAVAQRHAGAVHSAIALLGPVTGQTVAFHAMESGSSVLDEQSNVPRITRHIAMQTLDDLLHERSLGPAALLKLDVQGYELGVLRGGAVALAQADAVLLEVSFLEFNRGGATFAEIIAFMSEHGFCVYDICSCIRRSDLALDIPDGTLVQSDLLFVREESAWRPRSFTFAV